MRKRANDKRGLEGVGVLDGETLEKEVFPKLADELAASGEVHVDYDYVSQFAHYLMWQHREVWLRTEQDLHITDDMEARFYLRDV